MSLESAAINLDFTPGSIHGRVFLQDCLTIAEFQQEVSCIYYLSFYLFSMVTTQN